MNEKSSVLSIKDNGRVVTPPKGLVPPGKERFYAKHHWVTRVDVDGRTCGLEVYQWQPGTQRWCRPNEYASERDLELEGYRYIAVCPTPPFEQELAVFDEILNELRTTVVLTRMPPERRELFFRLIGEHLKVFRN